MQKNDDNFRFPAETEIMMERHAEGSKRDKCGEPNVNAARSERTRQ